MWRAKTIAVAIAAIGVQCATIALADGDGPQVRKVQIHKIVKDDCGESEDCDQRTLFIDKDGTKVEINGDSVDWLPGIGRNLAFRFAVGGFLGVELTDLTPELRAHFGAPEEAGVLVARVVDDSPAFKAGVEVGDVISAVDGKAVSSSMELAHLIRAKDEGALADLEVWRNGSVLTLTAAVEHRDSGFRIPHRIVVGCDSEGADCDFELGGGARLFRQLGKGSLIELEDFDFDCDGEECDITIDCDHDGKCTCTVNGDDRACDELNDLHGGLLHDD